MGHDNLFGNDYFQNIIDFSTLNYLNLNKIDRKQIFNQKEIDEIIEYLKNPTKTGIWKLSAEIDYERKESIYNFIWSKYFPEIPKSSGDDEFSYSFHTHKASKIQKNDKEFPDLKTITFQLRLFYYIYLKEKKEKIPNSFDSDSIKTMERINVEEVKKQYSCAYSIFKEKIVYPNFLPQTINGSFFIFANHHYCLINRNGASVEIESINLESIEILEDFLMNLNFIVKLKKRRFFSPQETVFFSYMIYMQNVFDYIIEYSDYKDKIGIAISEFNQNNYSHCVNTLGIFLELILTQMYETLFREELDEKLTIGELFYRIQNRVHDTVTPQSSVKSIDSTKLFTEINKAIDQLDIPNGEHNNKKILEILRLFIQYSKEKDATIREDLRRLTTKDNKLTIFPKDKFSNIIEFLEYRNAISHKSKISVNRFEAIRGSYCCITLYLWWMQTIEKIDWKLNRDDIIKNLVEIKNQKTD